MFGYTKPFIRCVCLNAQSSQFYQLSKPGFHLAFTSFLLILFFSPLVILLASFSTLHLTSHHLSYILTEVHSISLCELLLHPIPKIQLFHYSLHTQKYLTTNAATVLHLSWGLLETTLLSQIRAHKSDKFKGSV